MPFGAVAQSIVMDILMQNENLQAVPELQNFEIWADVLKYCFTDPSQMPQMCELYKNDKALSYVDVINPKLLDAHNPTRSESA